MSRSRSVDPNGTPATGSRRMARKKSCMEAFELEEQMMGTEVTSKKGRTSERVAASASSGAPKPRPMLLDFHDLCGDDADESGTSAAAAAGDDLEAFKKSPVIEGSFGFEIPSSANKENDPELEMVVKNSTPHPEGGAVVKAKLTLTGQQAQPPVNRNVRFIPSPHIPVNMSLEELDQSMGGLSDVSGYNNIFFY